MQVMVYHAETGHYVKEHWPDHPAPEASEFSLQQLKMDVDRLSHSSLPGCMMSRTAFHPGGGPQRPVRRER